MCSVIWAKKEETFFFFQRTSFSISGELYAFRYVCIRDMVARKQGHHHVLIIWNMLSLGQYIYMSLWFREFLISFRNISSCFSSPSAKNSKLQRFLVASLCLIHTQSTLKEALGLFLLQNTLGKLSLLFLKESFTTVSKGTCAQSVPLLSLVATLVLLCFSFIFWRR